MTRYRVTVRGRDIELRGFIEGESTLRVTSKVMEGIGVVVASEAPNDFNPFGITEPDNPPTLEKSIDILTGIAGGAENLVDLMETFAALHYGQAVVIRNERYQREKAEAELQARELHHFEVEQENEQLKAQFTIEDQDAGDRAILNGMTRAEYAAHLLDQIEQIKAIRSNFPEKCDVHDDDDITCGWKSMIAGIDKVLASDHASGSTT